MSVGKIVLVMDKRLRWYHPLYMLRWHRVMLKERAAGRLAFYAAVRPAKR